MKSTDKKMMALYIIFGLSFVIGIVVLVMPLKTKAPEGPGKAPDHTMGFLKEGDFLHTPENHVPYTVNKLTTRQYWRFIGVIAAFGISVCIGYILKKRRKTSDKSSVDLHGGCD
ncbi:MAG: hypothetical protein ACUBOA_03405 [Candidatus Loosdrechtia sp.]|uniref:hypothetical protein n=1 Tax=Candidatus Loosdrechtia sp. TaxID=3101272 RepID=UPI003A7913D7|nr:MAG: hypothetical protein QY305_05690 [Candidatus Jettenia sp. AMX2]